jgi:opacity protein-like surface antigen
VRTLRILTLIGILIASAPRTAAADWQIAPFIGLTFNGTTTLYNPESGVEKAHWSLGGTVGVVGAGIIGVEGIFLYTPGFFQNKDPSDFETVPNPGVVDSRATALMGNVVLTIPRSWNEYGLRPFVSGGVGLLHASSTDSKNVFPIDTNFLGYNVGGGAVGFLTERTGLRFDLRYFGTLKSKGGLPEGTSFGPATLSFWTASVGVVFRY